ncbi:tRNA (guanine-N(7)-)-methyltransferase non-catalytic subunit wuho isoform X2 [Wyeomyia smithii]|uniref:tRNA (guanine-N(7)-)-methyltransferase non-catalytic subunit wuho isoform X2 n=1 Tax=Wyeomyia smithii TaxID=174621 RepID=UPI002467C3F4|nr:tRNA (guanine-N(7)-)-methyltransferase non-catalytic subunit wuho isoform X2 [Wyeomyia smithii]
MNMSFIKLFRDSLIIAFNKKIFITSSATQWSNELDSTVPLDKGRPRKYFNADTDSDDEEDGQRPESKDSYRNKAKDHIVAMDVNESHSLLAIATGDKTLYLFEILEETANTDRLRLLSRRLVARSSSCMKFAPNGKFLIICDKGGDCYVYDCVDYGKPGRWVLGHMSQILDVLIDDEEKIITSDRDEKIRVTKYPVSHEIESFCLGHTEFVSQLVFLKTPSGQHLLSLSGDKTFRVWTYERGVEIFQQKIDHLGTKLTTTQLQDGSTLLAILCYEPTKIIIYRLYSTEPVQVERIQDLHVKSNEIFSSVVFDRQHNLVALIIDRNTEEVSQITFRFNQSNTNFVQDSLPKLFKDERLPYVDTVTFMFKKKFDNIKDYQDRKRKRIEEKGNK